MTNQTKYLMVESTGEVIRPATAAEIKAIEANRFGFAAIELWNHKVTCCLATLETDTNGNTVATAL